MHASSSARISQKNTRELPNVQQIPRFLLPHLNHLVRTLCEDHGHLLADLKSHGWLDEDQLDVFAAAVKNQGAPLENCVGFVDGTIRPTCRPHRRQKVAFSGHKRQDGLKFQSVMLPNGIIGSLMGP